MLRTRLAGILQASHAWFRSTRHTDSQILVTDINNELNVNNGILVTFLTNKSQLGNYYEFSVQTHFSSHVICNKYACHHSSYYKPVVYKPSEFQMHIPDFLQFYYYNPSVY
jgi:hypothetical protein